MVSSVDYGADLLFGVAVSAIPVAAGIAMFRYRLYDIDLVIRKTLVYGALTVVLGAVYVGCRARRPGRVLRRSRVAPTSRSPSRRSSSRRCSCRCGRACSGSSTAGSTAAATTRSGRSRRSARRLREHVELDTCTVDLTGVVDETMQPDDVSLWLRAEPRA